MNPLCFAYSMSGAAGIRSSFAVLAVACAVNMGYLHPPDSLMWVGSGWVVFLTAVATIVDFFGDKVPVLDHGLHALHLLLAPVAGGIAGMSGVHDAPLLSLILGVLGAGNALFIHSVKAGVRVVGNASTLGIAGPALSLLEDVLVLILVIIAIFAPILTAIGLILLTICMVKSLKKMTTA
jgi:hypothetical protein